MGGIQLAGSMSRSNLGVFIEKEKADVESTAGTSDVVDDEGLSFCFPFNSYLAESA
jgi:hypothetical protein